MPKRNNFTFMKAITIPKIAKNALITRLSGNARHAADRLENVTPMT